MDARLNMLGGELAGLDLRAEIDRLRKERNAVILAHYYQDPVIQDLADFVGDSLDLSRKAAATDAEVIAFCGVRFMAEVAKILSPQKTVVLPDMAAGCSLEDSCPPDQFARFRAQHPDHIALSYINCSAAVKALSDIIVTSSSAEKIISHLPRDQKIIFGPARHLGAYLNRVTGRDIPLWPGGGRVQPGRQLPSRSVRPLPRPASRSYRAQLYQLLGGREGALGYHRHEFVGGKDH